MVISQSYIHSVVSAFRRKLGEKKEGNLDGARIMRDLGRTTGVVKVLE